MKVSFNYLTLLKRWKSVVNAHKTNFKGSKAPGKYIIIESDDWGAIRTPSKEALVKFDQKGMDVKDSIYKYDALASENDVDSIFNMLSEIKDKNGNSPKITANTIVANPDFTKIKESGFTEYFYEPFTDTLKKYPEHKNAFSLWQNAMEEKLLAPQFHGREHLNVKRWMKRLQSNDDMTIFAFEHGATFSGKEDYSFMEAFDWDSKEDIADHERIIQDGMKLFEQIFGYRSDSIIAPCYNWDTQLEGAFATSGINVIQGIKNQLEPTGRFDVYQYKRHYYGEENTHGMHYNIRNCFLEPTMSPSKDWVDSCLAQIKNAFLWNRPAVICSHRINYVGYIHEPNRDRGINDLKEVLKKSLRHWPDIEFISTNELIKKQEWE